MSCDCVKFEPIELDRKSILRRIKNSPPIRKRLIEIAANTSLRLFLFRCPECGEFWQSGHEWHFADREYLFRVPPIEIADWLREPYRQPAAMAIYSALMRDFFERASFETSGAKCKIESCNEQAIRFSVFCRDHHIESMQELGQLPREPIGRFFPPYYKELDR